MENSTGYVKESDYQSTWSVMSDACGFHVVEINDTYFLRNYYRRQVILSNQQRFAPRTAMAACGPSKHKTFVKYIMLDRRCADVV